MKAAGSKNLRDELWQECKNDILFYLNAFCYLYEPRAKRRVLPFITYPYQDEGFYELVTALTHVEPDTKKIGYDLAIEKSRDMGLTWMVLALYDWRLRFWDYETYLIASRKAELVDDKGNPDELFWKLDFFEDNLPKFLQIEDRIRTKMHVENPKLHTTVDGESTNEGLAVGGRKTSIFFDENARMPNGQVISNSTADVSNCRLKVSTPYGPTTAFSQEITNKRIRVWSAHWSRHPDKAAGLYNVSDDGIITPLDVGYWGNGKHKDFKFCDEPPKNPKYKYRSPWYDEECKKRTPQDIAENLDIDHQRSQSLFFDSGTIARLAQHCCDPTKGELQYNFETGEVEGWRFTDQQLPIISNIWFKPDGHGNPPADRFYAVGVDTSAGTGASNSSISVWDMKERCKVAEFTGAKIRPEQFAVLAVAVCRWFRGPNDEGAFMAFEQNGPGRSFGQRVVELGYYNLYRRKPEATVTAEFKKIPGWFPTPGNKEALLTNYRRALAAGDAINRSRLALEECLDYVYMPNGTIEHVSQTDKADPSGARSNHGDRVIADALGVMLLGIKPPEIRKVEGKYEEPQPFSYLWRLKMTQDREDANSTY